MDLNSYAWMPIRIDDRASASFPDLATSDLVRRGHARRKKGVWSGDGQDTCTQGCVQAHQANDKLIPTCMYFRQLSLANVVSWVPCALPLVFSTSLHLFNQVISTRRSAAPRPISAGTLQVASLRQGQSSFLNSSTITQHQRASTRLCHGVQRASGTAPSGSSASVSSLTLARAAEEHVSNHPLSCLNPCSCSPCRRGPVVPNRQSRPRGQPIVNGETELHILQYIGFSVAILFDSFLWYVAVMSGNNAFPLFILRPKTSP